MREWTKNERWCFHLTPGGAPSHSFHYSSCLYFMVFAFKQFSYTAKPSVRREKWDHCLSRKLRSSSSSQGLISSTQSIKWKVLCAALAVEHTHFGWLGKRPAGWHFSSSSCIYVVEVKQIINHIFTFIIYCLFGAEEGEMMFVVSEYMKNSSTSASNFASCWVNNTETANVSCFLSSISSLRQWNFLALTLSQASSHASRTGNGAERTLVF